MIFSLAWRNIWRQPTRTALSVVGMAFTSALLVFMISFQFGSYDTMKKSMLQLADGFGQIQPVGYKDDPSIDKVIKDPSKLLAQVLAVPGVTAATPRATGFALLANGERSFAAAIYGVDPVTEPTVSTLGRHIDQGRALEASDSQAIVLGDALARNLQVKVGDTVTMLGSAEDGSVAADVLKVVGIFRSGVAEVDRSFAQMPLKRFQDTYLMGTDVNTIALAGDTVRAVEAAGGRLSRIARDAGLVYLNWAELRPEVKQSITLDFSTSILMYGTLVIVVVFIILNTLYMAVLERTREFGMLLAIGMRRRLVGRVVWAEMIFLALIGNGIGLALGIAITLYFERVGIQIAGMTEIYAQWGLPSRFYPAMTLVRVLSGPLAVTLSIAVMGVVPYRRIKRLRAVEAMA